VDEDTFVGLDRTCERCGIREVRNLTSGQMLLLAGSGDDAAVIEEARVGWGEAWKGAHRLTMPPCKEAPAKGRRRMKQLPLFGGKR
jgi:hypothetical protein